MNIPDHISESLETIFGVKILKFYDADPGWKKFGSVFSTPLWKKFGSGTWDNHPGSTTLHDNVRKIPSSNTATNRQLTRAKLRRPRAGWTKLSLSSPSSSSNTLSSSIVLARMRGLLYLKFREKHTINTASRTMHSLLLTEMVLRAWIFCFQLRWVKLQRLRSKAWLQAADLLFPAAMNHKLQRCVQMLDFKLLIVAASCWWFKLQRCVQMLDTRLLAAMIQASTLRSNAWLQAADSCFQLLMLAPWLTAVACWWVLTILASTCWRLSQTAPRC